MIRVSRPVTCRAMHSTEAKAFIRGCEARCFFFEATLLSILRRQAVSNSAILTQRRYPKTLSGAASQPVSSQILVSPSHLGAPAATNSNCRGISRKPPTNTPLTGDAAAREIQVGGCYYLGCRAGLCLLEQRVNREPGSGSSQTLCKTAPAGVSVRVITAELGV